MINFVQPTTFHPITQNLESAIKVRNLFEQQFKSTEHYSEEGRYIKRSDKLDHWIGFLRESSVNPKAVAVFGSKSGYMQHWYVHMKKRH